MLIKILKEAGYEEAITGLSLSYGISFERSEIVARRLARLDYRHNKFLESIFIWLDITAPRYWWQQADTYRLSTKQSESTMHTLLKRKLEQTDFEKPIPDLLLQYLNTLIENKELATLKNVLPEGFLQRRIWVVSYKEMRNIIKQRKEHRLDEWKFFCSYVLSNVNYPYFLE